MAMKIKVDGAVFEFDDVEEYLKFAEATGLKGLAEEDSAGTPTEEPLGKDANGEYLYEGDYVTGLEDNGYSSTDDTVVMEIVGAGESPLFNDVNIKVMIVGDWSRYNVNSSDFVKLSDNLDEAKAKFSEINSDREPKFEVGDKVKVVENKSGGHVVGTIGEIGGVRYIESQNRWSYEVNPISGHEKNRRRHHSETDLNIVSDSTEFRNGDIVRATEDVVGFGGRYFTYNAGELMEVQTGGSGALCLAKGFWKNAYVSENLANIELVCRKEDRKDIEL